MPEDRWRLATISAWHKRAGRPSPIEGRPVGRIHPLHTEAGSMVQTRLRMPMVTSTTGEGYLKLPTDVGVVLSTLLALHLAAYAASTLVRYHPGFWSTLVGKTKGDAVAPVLSAAVSAVEEHYPALILGALGG